MLASYLKHQYYIIARVALIIWKKKIAKHTT